MTRTLDTLRREHVARLDLLDLGRFDVGPGKRLIPISAWLITTDAGRRLLLDTGFPSAYATDPHGMAKADGLGSFGQLVDFGPRHTILGALALHGLAARDITHVLLSHSHIDHIGGLPDLPDAEIILSSAERTLPRPLYFGAARRMDWPGARYRLLDRSTDICGGLRMIATPGHTPGHLSAMIKLPGQTVVLAIDAINRHTEPAEHYPDAMDPLTAARSGQRLLLLARRNDARLIPGHEPIMAAVGTA